MSSCPIRSYLTASHTENFLFFCYTHRLEAAAAIIIGRGLYAFSRREGRIDYLLMVTPSFRFLTHTYLELEVKMVYNNGRTAVPPPRRLTPAGAHITQISVGPATPSRNAKHTKNKRLLLIW
eukprot:gene9046-6346_t